MTLIPVLKKEIIDGLRDRRALIAALVSALLGPIFVALAINIAAAARDSAPDPIRLCGAGQAPDLLTHLREAGFKLSDDARVCLDIPADYAERLATGKTAYVHVIADLNSATTTTNQLRREIQAFSNMLAMKRLLARGISPNVVKPIEVEMRSTNPVSRAATFIGNLLILYFVFAPFLIVAAMASDTTAGERERHSLEPLLTHAVGTIDIVVGKFLALATVNIAGTATCIALSLLLVQHSPVAELGLRVETGFAAGAAALLILVPLCMLAAAIQLALGLFSKTAKEATQVTMFVSLLPVLVGVLLMGPREVHVGVWPVAWELKAIAAPLLGSTTVLAPFAVVAMLELTVVAGTLLAAARRLGSERVLG
jgi:sodium transport system permease protein